MTQPMKIANSSIKLSRSSPKKKFAMQTNAKREKLNEDLCMNPMHVDKNFSPLRALLSEIEGRNKSKSKILRISKDSHIWK